MKRRTSCVCAAANAAVAAIVLSATAGTASALVNLNDIALGVSYGQDTGSPSVPALFLGRNAVSTPVSITSQPSWSSQEEIEGVSFDNLNGVNHNFQGNLLGVYFGGATNGGSIYSFATDNSAGNFGPTNEGSGNNDGGQLIFGNGYGTGPGFVNGANGTGTTDFVSRGLSVTEISGIAASPNNDLLAFEGDNTGVVDVVQYNAGNGTSTGPGSTASIGAGTANAGQVNAVYASGSTIDLTFLDEKNGTSVGGVSHMVGLDGNGHLLLQTVTKTATGYTVSSGSQVAAMGINTGANLSGEANIVTQTIYNPQVSPYIYAIQSNSNGLDYNTVGVFSFTPGSGGSAPTNFSEVATYNLSQWGGTLADGSQVPTAALGDNMQGAKDLAIDSHGDLLFSVYTGTQAPDGHLGTDIYELKNSGWNNTGWGTTGGTTAFSGLNETNPGAVNVGSLGLLGFFGAQSNFSGIDVALGTGISVPTPLRWTGLASNTAASDTSGTWDNVTSNWTNGSNVTWTEGSAAEFGAGSGTGNPPVLVTLAGPHTVSTLTFFPGSPAYTLSGSSITLLGDALSDGIEDNSATVTIASALVLPSGPVPTVDVAAGGVLTLSGPISGNELVMIGSGTMNLTNTGNSQVGTAIGPGFLPITNFAELGNPTANLSVGGGTVIFTVGGTLTNGIDLTAASAISIGTNNLTLASPLQGGGGFAKYGTGTLTALGVDNASTGTLSGRILVYQGTVVDGAGTFVPSITGGKGTGLTALGGATVSVGTFGGSGTLILSSPGDSGVGTVGMGLMDIHLEYGGNLVASGGGSQLLSSSSTVSAVKESSAGLQTVGAVSINTPTSSDVLMLASEVDQWSDSAPINLTGPTFATIKKTGAGRLILASGGVTSDDVFDGSWSVSGGILQVGPELPNIIPSGFPATSSTDNGPFGEPLNALGFAPQSTAPVGSGGSFGDPDRPASATISTGGMLAIAVDEPNVNPNITAGPLNPTPNYIRASITLAGGTLASTGSEVTNIGGVFPTIAGGTTLTTTQSYSYGVPDGTPVSAQVGGTFTVAAGSFTSEILVSDPNGTLGTGGDTGARNVNLVGGAYEIQVAVPGDFNPGDQVTEATNWNGALEVTPGTLSQGGVFNIDRTYSYNDIVNSGGTINVTPLINVTAGASIKIDSGAGVVLQGPVDQLSNGTTSVNVIDNSSGESAISVGGGTYGLDVIGGGTQIVGTLTGTGNVGVASSTLVATQVRVGTLNINSGTVIFNEGSGAGSLGAIHAPTSGTLGTGSVSSLTLSPTSTLNLTTHALVINYNGQSGANLNYEGIPSPIGELTFGKHTPTQSYPAGTITRYVQNASDGGSWDLPGITSSVAEGDFTGTTAVGVIDQNDLFALQGNDYTTANGGPGTWEGVPVANDNNVLVRYTYYGDTNLDGVVDANDVDNVIQGFEGFGDGWLYGDFNYDGLVNGLDVTELIIGFSGQKNPMGDGGISPGQAQFLLSLATGITPAEVAKFDAIVGVPEPTTIGLLGAATIGLLGRRRRR